MIRDTKGGDGKGLGSVARRKKGAGREAEREERRRDVEYSANKEVT